MDANGVKAMTEWYEKIKAHAVKNYGQDGWDMFVECIDLKDFASHVRIFNLDTYENAFDHYREWCDLKADRRKDQRAEADSSW